jgi:hypothetical protein
LREDFILIFPKHFPKSFLVLNRASNKTTLKFPVNWLMTFSFQLILEGNQMFSHFVLISKYTSLSLDPLQPPFGITTCLETKTEELVVT